jgi:Skp family chaperone for outer membrane proteins
MNLILIAMSKSYKASLSGVLVLLFFVSFCHGQRGVRIGYIDTEYILENVDDYQAAQSQLDAKVQQWKSQVDQQLAKLETQKKQLDNERVLLTDELIKRARRRTSNH